MIICKDIMAEEAEWLFLNRYITKMAKEADVGKNLISLEIMGRLLQYPQCPDSVENVKEQIKQHLAKYYPPLS